MNHAKRSLFGIALLILVYSLASAQQPAEKTPHPSLDYSNDPCGNPLMESQAWLGIKGRVTKVVDGRTLMFLPEGEHRSVRIQVAGVSVDRPASAKARHALTEIVLNKTIEVLAPLEYHEAKPESIVGVVHLADGKPTDVGLFLISSGLARWEPPKPYIMSMYTGCQYRKAEAEAKEKKVGIWQ